MNEWRILAALLTVALNQRPAHNNSRVGKLTPQQIVMQDYQEFLKALAVKHPDLVPKG